MIRRLLGILGPRATLTFGLVTFLVGALLATVNMTSRYALKVYVDDQLRRIPWDLAVYQQGAVGNDRSLATHIARAKGVIRVESLAYPSARSLVRAASRMTCDVTVSVTEVAMTPGWPARCSPTT